MNHQANHKDHQGHEGFLDRTTERTTKDTKSTKVFGLNQEKAAEDIKAMTDSRTGSFAPIPGKAERVGKALLDAAVEVHRHLGPGFLERIYEEALCHELTLREVPFECQKPVRVSYKGVPIGDQRIDLLIADQVIAELKAVENILPIHQAQLLSYLKATDLRLGYIINFKVRLLKHGIKRMVR